MNRRIPRLSVTLAAAALVVWACSSTPTAPPTPVPTTIELNKTSVSLDAVDATDQLTATVRDQNGNAMSGQTVTWASSATGVATVSGAGLVTAVDNGSATVTATAGNANTSASVTVQQVPTTMAKVSGDMGFGPPGATLSEQLVVVVADRLANPVSGVSVQFAVTVGGGGVSPSDATTDAAGEAKTQWTLGGSEGAQTVEARNSSLTGSPLEFTATAANLTIGSVSPDPVVEGQSAIITGTGFDPTPANNTVTFDGLAAAVTAATATTLTVTVPTTDCQPAQDVDVVVTVSGANSNMVSHAAEPASFVTLAVGEQTILQSPSDLCLQFEASGSSEEYLVGVQSATEVAATLTPIQLIGAKDPAAPAPPAMMTGAFFSAGGSSPLNLTPRAQRLRRHREAEARLRSRERDLLGGMAGAFPLAAGAGAQFAVDSTVSVGDTVTVRVGNLAAFSCSNFATIQAVVRAKGQKGIWLEDAGNPTGGFSAADFQAMSDDFDTLTAFVVEDYFGQLTDTDANGHTVVVVTKEINANSTSTLGFATNADFATQASCGMSNEGEFFYGRAPDPTDAVGGGAYATADALDDYPFVIAHELTHVVQLGNRIVAGSPGMTSWEKEGQATLSEEVVGHAFEGRAPGNNYGFNIAWNNDDPTSIDWYSNGFIDLLFYYGFETSTTQVTGAPEQCSWLDDAHQSPCGGRALWYGVSWSFLRWLSDNYSSGFGAGEKGLHRALIASTDVGFANIVGRVGVPIDSLLAEWSAMLWVDDSVSTANAKLTMASWDLRDIWNNLVAGAQLLPTAVSFGDFTSTTSVRAASNAYYLVSSATRPSVAIRARDMTDAALPSHMQLYVVRTK